MKYIYDDLEDKNILITGGAGFIGSNIAYYLNKYHPKARIFIFDKFRSNEIFSNGNLMSLGHFKNLLEFRGEIIIGDLANKNDLAKLDNLDFDYIFHQGAISDTTCLDQELVLKTNYESFDYFINKAKNDNAVLIYSSSAAVYGKTTAPNIVGSGEIPENVYGFSKLLMDKKIREIIKDDSNKDFKIIALRYFNVYGSGEYFKGNTSSMILQIGIQALKNKKVRLFEFGEQLRDFVYIKDVIQANIKAMESIKSGIYNVGNGVARSFNDIVNILKNHIGDFEVEYIKNPHSFYQNHTQADISNTTKDLFYEPRYSLESGIEDYIDVIRDISCLI
ncbi:ADP-glyceromanno-heptose 6-epimerase [Helicobacter sp. MIT 14-3879]|uniref:ADP-glyceromanno-heptose 6-epimerase n=1 Tax=Helicobacter sp. MIT 14-3879 TaxID=2040649 RepID=UPI000E1F86A9|nr:ADP-glyceromanno-heptose 6-epimerase [Helicobacter sp. MIT 14-3879]RDU63958.1 ADP-glyceromanno-heptose 6-epimerase [Helicobacter sp. MIT 14-3879]